MIHPYPSDIDLTRPDRFTDPFRYRPHPLVTLAAESLMERIKNTPELSEMFAEGKMLGVLAVSYGPDFQQTGYLAGFSRLAGGRSVVNGFVPPIYDLTAPDGYYKNRESEISAVNNEISELSSSSELEDLRAKMETAQHDMSEELSTQKKRMEELKAKRDLIRKETIDEELAKELTRQSQFEKAQLRRLKVHWEEIVESIRSQIRKTEDRIIELKRLRKKMSDDLQDWIFRQYRVHDFNGNELSISDIFKANGLVPPGGTGECVAPKLLEYAYRNGMKPLAMGEFWYGASPDTAVRTEGHFYPSCTSKCGPLLGYMTQGLDMEKETAIHGSPEILYEDDDIVVAHKPSGMPSVPGLNGSCSLQEWLAEKTGCQKIESVHRLDMDTYGVMLFAKNSMAGSYIRMQFEEHSVRKTYRAILSPMGTGCINKGETGFISLPLSPDYDERPRQKADLHQGKEALTEYHVDDILADGRIMITYHPLTGRTHQLRVHSAHHLGMGHAIMGDLLYGGGEAQHMCLHAVEIELTLPFSGQRVIFSDKA